LEKIFRDEFLVTSEYVVLTKDTIKLLLPAHDAEHQGYFIQPERETCEVTEKLNRFYV